LFSEGLRPFLRNDSFCEWKKQKRNVAAQWAFHNAMLGAKQQVLAQFDDDSDEAQALGLTKKSERAKPSKAKAAAATAK
jgi:hypothetical protein